MKYKFSKYWTILALLVVLVSPAVTATAAQSVTDLQTQIQLLLKQIQALQQQLAQAQGETAEWCHTFKTNFGVGSSGEEVVALVTALSKENIQTPKEANFYDEAIASAVSVFQEKYRSEILDPAGLSAGTGYVGSKTRAKLNALYGCKGNTESFISLKSKPVPYSAPSSNASLPPSVQGSNISSSCQQQLVSELQFADVSGIKSLYAPGEKISLIVKGTGLPGGMTASPNCGFNVQAAIFNHQRTKTYASVNGSFDEHTGLWSINMPAPIDTLQTYDMELFLYCGNTTCGLSASGANIQAPTQQVKTYTFSLVGSTVGSTTQLQSSVTEQIKCVFKGSTTMQTCTVAVDSSSPSYGKNCSGTDACVVDVSGHYGEKLTWKSSCGGYAYTLMDGTNESAQFDCSQTQFLVPTPSPSSTTATTPIPMNGTNQNSLFVSPTSLSFSAMQGGANPASQTLTVTVYVPVLWNALVINGTINGTPWLSVSQSVYGKTATVSVNLSNLAAGTYSGSILISGAPPLIVPVTLIVTPSMTAQNHPPIIADLNGTGLASGTESGSIFSGQTGTYTVTAKDPDSGDFVRIVIFNWGDGTANTTIGPSNYNGASVSASHAWPAVPGTIIPMKVIVQDTHGMESQKSVSILITKLGG